MIDLHRSRGNLTASVSVEGHRRLGCEGESPYFHPPVPVSRIDSEFQRRRGKSQTRRPDGLRVPCRTASRFSGPIAAVARGPLEAFSRTPSAELADAPFHCPPDEVL